MLSTPRLSVAHKPVLIDVLNLNLRWRDLHQSERVNAAIIRIVWLPAIVKPLHRDPAGGVRRVMRKTTIAETHSLDPHEFRINNTKVFMSPDPAVDLFRVQKWL